MRKRGNLKPGYTQGFTLVEIMIVVVIIGLLAAISVPAYLQSKIQSQASALANDFRIYASAFEIYATENGQWPPDVNRATIPAGMEGQLPGFTVTTVIGGNWDWDPGVLGYAAAISLVGSRSGTRVLERVDEILDDGDPSSGRMRISGNRLIYILEQ